MARNTLVEPVSGGQPAYVRPFRRLRDRHDRARRAARPAAPILRSYCTRCQETAISDWKRRGDESISSRANPCKLRWELVSWYPERADADLITSEVPTN
jgi:hypothetical protein